LKRISLAAAFIFLTALSSHGGRLLNSYNIGLGTGISEVGKDLDSKVILNFDLLYRLSERTLLGLETDLNLWSWDKPSPHYASTLNDTLSVTVGRAGFLASFRAEAAKDRLKLFGQLGLGAFSDNVNMSGGGVNGPPKGPPFEWAPGFDLQGGIGFKKFQFKLSNKNLFSSRADTNWFGASIGLCLEYF
jgi:hypothetical protein